MPAGCFIVERLTIHGLEALGINIVGQHLDLFLLLL
jgi:hypothetical protein